MYSMYMYIMPFNSFSPKKLTGYLRHITFVLIKHGNVALGIFKTSYYNHCFYYSTKRKQALQSIYMYIYIVPELRLLNFAMELFTGIKNYNK